MRHSLLSHYCHPHHIAPISWSKMPEPASLLVCTFWPARRIKEKGKCPLTLRKLKVYLHPMVESNHIKHMKGSLKIQSSSGQWCSLLAVNNMEILLLKKRVMGRIMVPQRCLLPDSQNIPVTMLLFIEKGLFPIVARGSHDYRRGPERFHVKRLNSLLLALRKMKRDREPRDAGGF